MHHILTVAGSDSCAGAGIQADLKTIAALGGYGLTVITAVTAQNTRGISAISTVSPEMVKAQMEAIFSDIRVDAVKIGMLAHAGLIRTIAACLASRLQTGKYRDLKIVIDPVMVAKSGDPLLHGEALEALKRDLFPLAALITPNLPEAGILLGQEITSEEEMIYAAKKLAAYGSDWVLVKGGHLPGEPVDVLVSGDQSYRFRAKRIITANNHGTGCTLSSALAVFLARGYDMPRAVQEGKEYITRALAQGFPIGRGYGVLQHFIEEGSKKTGEVS